MEEVKNILLDSAKHLLNPFRYSLFEEVAPVINGLRSVDREEWAAAFGALAMTHEERATEAEVSGDRASAAKHYLMAYDSYRVARYPTLNSPGKLAAYRKSQTCFLKAASYLDIPVERVEMPFHGRPGEGSVSVGLLRKPKGVAKPPVLVMWGGIDAYKEERRTDQYLKAGMATLCIDMPGVADAPIAGAEDAERLWDAVFDYIAERTDLDEERVAVIGGSTGGYWGAKVAHTHCERLRAAVNHGGPAHFAFTPDWIMKAQRGEYPFELAETLACAFGRSTGEEWLEYSPRLSLLDQGILERPCAPLLCINGINDTIFPIADMYLLLEHGAPKAARFDSGAHMGGSEAQSVIVGWLRNSLA